MLTGMFMPRFAVLSLRTHCKEVDVMLEPLREFVRKG